MIRVISDAAQYTGRGTVLALGMFDGVHLGHRALIAKAVSLARALGLDAMVCTFDRHPMSVIAPGSEPRMLMTVAERLAAFEQMGADWALVRPFTPALSDVDAEAYLRDLVSGTRARAVVAGENYTFGKGGAGGARLLRRVGKSMGFQTAILKSVTDGGDVVSSTLIRRLIAAGEFQRASRLLGSAEKIAQS